jgi:hypothetical protein
MKPNQKPNQKLVELLEKTIELLEKAIMTALQESESPMRACELATSRKTSGRWIKKEKA